MQLEHQSPDAEWAGTVPTAFDGRLLAGVVVLSALAASVNVPYGGIPVALAAFGLLACGGVVCHVVGERRCRRITAELTERWAARGGTVDDVTRTAVGARTEWVVHTEEGPVTITGLALAPVSKLSVEWGGIGDAESASALEDRVDEFADEWYATVFE